MEMMLGMLCSTRAAQHLILHTSDILRTPSSDRRPGDRVVRGRLLSLLSPFLSDLVLSSLFCPGFVLHLPETHLQPGGVSLTHPKIHITPLLGAEKCAVLTTKSAAEAPL